MLRGKNAIITGANRGIGSSTVECFAKNGANIWACARTKREEFEKDMVRICEDYGVEIWPVYFDVTDEAQIKQAVSRIRKQKISIDILVNMAGIVESSEAFQMTSIDKMKHLFETNFFAVTLLTQYVSRLMARQDRGSIVNIASIAGFDGEPAQYEYVASKAALIGATRNLAREFAQYHIRVNAVAPGMIETDMGRKIETGLRDRMLNKTILKRMGKPYEIANVVAFLASDLASYVNGQILRVDGGV